VDYQSVTLIGASLLRFPVFAIDEGLQFSEKTVAIPYKTCFGLTRLLAGFSIPGRPDGTLQSFLINKFRHFHAGKVSI
jgi:hypothetical protein